eukprot:SM000072S21244  [mRNA]  locus=s72:555259:557020:- [translate_table: standard]
MTSTWRRSPGAQPPHQQHVRRFGGNERQRSASSALRLPQGGSRRLDRHSVAPPIPEREQTALLLSQAAGPAFSCTADPELTQRALSLSLAAGPAFNCTADPELKQRALPFSQTGLQLHRRFLNSSKEHCRSPRRLDRPSVAPPIPEVTQRALPFSQFAYKPQLYELLHHMEQKGIVIALLAVSMMFIFFVNIALDEELTLLIWEQERKASENQAKRRRLWSYERSTTYAHTLMHEGVEIVDEGGPRASHGLVAKVGVAS